MTYSVGSTILSDDYNVFATGASNGAPTNSANVNNLWGVGNGNYGFGQSTTLSAVASENTITATQWSKIGRSEHMTDESVCFMYPGLDPV